MRLRVMVASPATGKSTWCREHAAELGEVLSTDQIRAEIGAGEQDQTVSGRAFDIVELRAGEHLAAGRDVTIDATGAHPRDRARWLALAAKHDAIPVAVRLRCSLPVALWRNWTRARRVRVWPLVRMWRAVRRLSAEQLKREGFAEVIDART